MHGKGHSADATPRKHRIWRQLSSGQVQVALQSVLKRRGSSALIVDMHAGDGEGVLAIQPDLFEGQMTATTPELAILEASKIRKQGVRCDVVLCEKALKLRGHIRVLAAKNGAEFVANHLRLPDHLKGRHYDWALIFNDPNGYRDHGDGVLQWLASEIRKADFIIMVNEGSVARNLGVKGEYPDNRFARAVALRAPENEWRLDPKQWARRLGRRRAIVSPLVGRRGMRGKVYLISNFPQTLPRGFTRYEV